MRYRMRLTRVTMDRPGPRQEEESVLTITVKWMTVKQVSDYLQISVSKVYQLAQGGEIPCCRLGQQWRFEREEIDRWLRRTLRMLDELERK